MNEENNIKVKTCPDCGEKDINKFYKNKNRKDGYATYCIKCHNERYHSLARQKRYYRKHKDEIKIKNQQNKEERNKKQKEYIAKNPERYKAMRYEAQKRYREKHRDEINERRRKKYRENKNKDK